MKNRTTKDKIAEFGLNLSIRKSLTFLFIFFIVAAISSYLLTYQGRFELLVIKETYNWTLSTIYQGLGAILGLLGLIGVFVWQAHKNQEAQTFITNVLKPPFVCGFVVIALSIFFLSIGPRLSYSEMALIVVILGIMGALTTSIIGLSLYLILYKKMGVS